MTFELIFFFVLAAVAVAAAVGMLSTKNPVYAALFLILNFSAIAIFYLMLVGPFIAMAQITVYGGAIMVLFLFVIMLLGSEDVRPPTRFRWQGPLAVFLGVILLGQLVYVVLSGTEFAPRPPEPTFPGFGSPENLGQLLFSKYLLPFEVTSIVLLVAMIGAIVLTQKEKRQAAAAELQRAVREAEETVIRQEQAPEPEPERTFAAGPADSRGEALQK